MKFEPQPLNMMAEPTVSENVLNQEDYKNLYDKLLRNDSIPLYYHCGVGANDDTDFYFVHHIFDATNGWVGEPSAIKVVKPILKDLGVKAIIRIKINFYARTEKIFKHSPHTDMGFKCKTALFYVNDNDGYTGFADGTKMPSKANTLINFDSQIPHYSTTCTDQNLRCTINLNYF